MKATIPYILFIQHGKECGDTKASNTEVNCIDTVCKIARIMSISILLIRFHHHSSVSMYIIECILTLFYFQ